MLSLEQVSNTIKMIGLVAGGLWTAWTFHKLQKVRAAEVENDRQLAEIQKSRLEQQEVSTRLLGQQPQLAVELAVVERQLPAAQPQACLHITINLKNEGSQNLLIQFDDSALTVGHLILARNGERKLRELQRSGPMYVPVNSDEPEAITERLLRVGQRRQLAFAVPIAKPGAYFIQFSGVYVRCSFDGEETHDTGNPIYAVEQAIVFTGGSEAS
jgi:hypothetical protein